MTLRELLKVTVGTVCVRVYRNNIMLVSGYVSYFDLESNHRILNSPVKRIVIAEYEKMIIILE